MPSKYARSNVGDGWDSYRRNYVRENGYTNARSVREEARGGNDDLAVMRRSRMREYYDDRDYNYDAGRRSIRQRDPRGNYGEVRSYRRDVQTDGYEDGNGYRRSRRRDSAPGYGYEDDRRLRRSRSEREPSSRRDQDQERDPGRDQHQLQRYDPRQASNNEQQQNKTTNADSEATRGLSRHFDNGVDGWIAGAAGAALGAITARHFAGGNEFKRDVKGGQQQSQKNRFQRNWKTIAGAAVGAVAANAAEHSFTSYFEDENVEHAMTGIEGAGEGVAAFAPDIL